MSGSEAKSKESIEAGVTKRYRYAVSAALDELEKVTLREGEYGEHLIHAKATQNQPEYDILRGDVLLFSDVDKSGRDGELVVVETVAWSDRTEGAVPETIEARVVPLTPLVRKRAEPSHDSERQREGNDPIITRDFSVYRGLLRLCGQEGLELHPEPELELPDEQPAVIDGPQMKALELLVKSERTAPLVGREVASLFPSLPDGVQDKLVATRTDAGAICVFLPDVTPAEGEWAVVFTPKGHIHKGIYLGTRTYGKGGLTPRVAVDMRIEGKGRRLPQGSVVHRVLGMWQ